MFSEDVTSQIHGKSAYMMTTHPHMQPSLLSALRFKWDPVANLLPEL